MVILAQGGEKFRDAVAAIILTGEYGSDATIANESDTALGTPIAASIKTLANTTSGLNIQSIHELRSTEANGNTLREFALQDSALDLTRVTTTEVVKDATKEIITINTLTISIN